MNKFMRLAATAAAAVALTLGGASGALAAAGDCDLTYACGWKDRDFANTSYGTAQEIRNWRTVGMGNLVSSVSVNGKTCRFTRYYASWNLTTNMPYGDYFTMYSRTMVNQNWKDPYLTNGAGFNGAGIDWNDDIEATWFTGCGNITTDTPNP